MSSPPTPPTVDVKPDVILDVIFGVIVGVSHFMVRSLVLGVETDNVGIRKVDFGRSMERYLRG